MCSHCNDASYFYKGKELFSKVVNNNFWEQTGGGITKADFEKENNTDEGLWLDHLPEQ